MGIGLDLVENEEVLPVFPSIAGTVDKVSIVELWNYEIMWDGLAGWLTCTVSSSICIRICRARTSEAR